MIDLLDATPLFTSVINFLIYHIYYGSYVEESTMPEQISTVLMVNIVGSLLVFFMPWGWIMEKVKFVKNEPSTLWS